MSMQKRTFGRRINDWLEEPEGEQFTDGKWRFWLPAVFGFSVLNAVLTVMIFRESGSANYLTPALLAASALVGWIAIGCLHYSDAKRGKMARGVSALDSASLLFVIGHFCFLVYILGHGWILRSAEAEYKVAIAAYNEKVDKVSEDNRAIADAATKIAELETKRARLDNDAAYQLRKAAQAGAKVRTAPRSGSAASGLATSPVELAPPPKAPDDTQAAFLTRWDAWVRITNFGELILAAITLIFIRNWTAKSNAPARRVEEFPSEIDAGLIENRAPTRRENFAKKKDMAKTYMSFDLARAEAGLKKLREALKDISFRLAGVSFKADVNPNLKECRKTNVAPDHIWIRAMRANQGTQETMHSAKAKLSILDDAITMAPDAFRERLERFLRQNGFEI